MNKEALIGKKIKEITIDGYSLFIVTEDGIELEYQASDGGYSSWEIKEVKEMLE